MPSEHPASALYSPTAEEEAYALYIYQKLFRDFPIDGTIHLEAKPTLAVLGRSGVDGIILRTIWSVVDPEATRCLTNFAQFHVVLRLISLAQDGLLEAEINKAFQQKNKATPMKVFQKTLWMSSDYRDCPLPTFEGVAVPSKTFLRGLSKRMKGIPASSPAPAPTPIPIQNGAPAQRSSKQISHPQSPSTRVASTKLKDPRTPDKKDAPLKQISIPNKDTVPNVINVKKKRSSGTNQDKSIQSAIQQIETLGVDSPNPKIKDLKALDPDNFELLQEQAALQRAIIESNKATTTKPAKKPQAAAAQPTDILSEEAALQKAIYESTHDASPKKSPPPPVAKAPMKSEHHNWLRMASLNDSMGEHDKNNDGGDSDDEYKKKKSKRGDADYADYIASLESSAAPTVAVANQKKESSSGTNVVDTDHSQHSHESDKKPAAKPVAPKPAPEVKKEPPTTKSKTGKEGKKTTTRNADDNRVDEYPQAVQELVMNGFELEKAIQGYKMLGDNFDDIVLFLTSNMTVKELVINGFNIHKVVQAYDLIGDNMDDLLAYLMANAT